MEASVALIASLTVNFCILFVLVVSWILRSRRRGSGRRLEVEEDLKDGCELESDTHERKPAKQIEKQTSTESMDAFVLSDIVMSTFCIGTGLFIITSSSLWQCPFVCSVTPSKIPATSSNQPVNQTPFGPVPSALLSAAFGTFIFSFSHLIYTGWRFHLCSIWSVVHGGYLCVNIIAVCVILTTGENLLGATLILLMESDVAIEQICQVVDRYAADKRLRKARVMLSVLGCTMSFGTRVAMPWVLCLSLGHLYNPIEMMVQSLGVASFGFIFYQAYALLAMKQQCERIKKVVSEDDKHTCIAHDAIEPYEGKSRCSSQKSSARKDMAFYLMNEGLIEISSYAKTVAGAITGKKLVPVQSLRDDYLPVKTESKSIKNMITST